VEIDETGKKFNTDRREGFGDTWALTMVLGVVVARTLSKPEFGSYSFCMFVLVVLSMLSRYGLESVMMRFGGSAWHQKEVERFLGYSAWAVEMTIRNAVLLTILAVLVLYGLFV